MSVCCLYKDKQDYSKKKGQSFSEYSVREFLFIVFFFQKKKSVEFLIGFEMSPRCYESLNGEGEKLPRPHRLMIYITTGV